MDAFEKIVCRFAVGLLLAGLFLSIALTGEGSGASARSAGPISAPHGAANLSAGDQQFIEKATEGSLTEVELGQLALQKASSREVKTFGQRMIDDHTRVNDQLKKIAADKGIHLPQASNHKNKATKDRLGKFSGSQFDTAYMAEMLKDHRRDVAEFRRERTAALDADLRTFAVQTLATLEEDVKQAETIAPELSAALHKPGAGISRVR